MKRNDILIIISLVFYSILFYKQSAGINYAIFSVILTALLYIRDNSLTKNIQWIGAAIGSIATGVSVALIGSPLTIIANITALSLLSAYSISKKTSVIFGLFYSAISYASSIAFIIIDTIERKPKNKPKQEKGSKFWTKVLVYSAIAVVVILFFVLYRNSNALFKEFTKDINLDFISWQWIFFMFLGFLLLYGFFIHRNIPGMYKKEEETSDLLNKESINQKESRLFGKSFTIHSEYFSGLVLLGLLNFMILFVNILDISYLWTGAELPEDLTYADLVHQGVGNLIFSIIIAILIILFYFRSKLNFYEKKKTLQILGYIWIIQNIFMVVSTMLRNQLYIEQYLLTHKRIGVYVYLVLAVIGLITTFVKIMQTKSNWFLYRKNGWAFFFVMVFACFIHWDMLITNYNMKHSKSLDKYYLLDLSWGNTPDLLQLKIDQEELEYDYPIYSNHKHDEFRLFNRDFYWHNSNFTARLHYKMFDFLEHYKKMDWQSWTLSKSKTYNRIKKLEAEGKLDSLYLKSNNIESIKPIAFMQNIQFLDLSQNNIADYKYFEGMKKLKSLDLSSNNMDSISDLPKLPELRELIVSDNNINSLAGLENFDKLSYLDISNNQKVKLSTLPAKNKIEAIDISSNNIKSYKSLKKLSNLQELYASQMVNRDITTMPLLPHLKVLDLSSNNISDFDMQFFKKLTNYESLEVLNLASNNFNNLYMLTNNIFTDRTYVSKSRSDIQAVYSNLVKLNISGNSIYDTYPLTVYQHLEELNIGGNRIDGLENIAQLLNLKSLNLMDNDLENLNHLSSLKQLKVLSINRNKLKSFKQLTQFNKLEELDIASNKLTDIEGIEKLKNLKKLDLRGNNIIDISGIENLTKLRSLDISYNAIEDFTPLYNMKWLKELKVYNVSYDIVEKLRVELPNTNVMKYENRY